MPAEAPGGFRHRDILQSPVFLFLALVAIAPPAIQLLETNTRILYGLAIWSGVLWAMLLYRLFGDRQLPFRWALGTVLFTTFVAFPMLELYVWLPPNVTGWFLRSDSLGLRFAGFSLGVGVREELFKAMPLLAMAVLTGYMRNPINGIVLGLMSGVGFAVAENVYFVFQTLDSALAAVQETGALGYLVVPIYNNVVRMAMTPFLHGCFSGIFGYFIARAATDRPRRVFFLVFGLALSAVLHGMYDTLVGTSPLLGMAVEGASFFLLMTLILRARGMRSPWQLGGGVFNRRKRARASSNAWQLRGLAGSVEGRMFPLDGHELSIGRDWRRCAVHVPEMTVSRQHASLSPQGHGRWRLTCVSSCLPVFVNGTEVDEAVVKPGDTLTLGTSSLIIEPAGGEPIEIKAPSTN